MNITLSDVFVGRIDKKNSYRIHYRLPTGTSVAIHAGESTRLVSADPLPGELQITPELQEERVGAVLRMIVPHIERIDGMNFDEGRLKWEDLDSEYKFMVLDRLLFLYSVDMTKFINRFTTDTIVDRDDLEK